MTCPDGDEGTTPAGSAFQARKRGDVDRLLEFLASTDLASRRAAVYQLGEMRSERAVEPLTRCLQASDDNIRIGAINALAKIGDRSVGSSIYEVATTDPLLRARFVACWALATLRDDRASAALVELIRKRDLPSRPWFLKRAARTLVELRATDSIPVLEEASQSVTMITRWRLKRAIAALRGFQAREHQR